MKLFEFQGKELFKEYGIPIQSGRLLTSPEESLEALTPPMVIKSQVLTGGRGKAGGIKIWEGNDDLHGIVDRMFKLSIKGEQVNAVLALNSVDILKELYIAITFNKSDSTCVLIAGASGGVDIEKHALDDEQTMSVIPFNSLLGLSEYQIRMAAKTLSIDDYATFRSIVLGMYGIFKDYDAVLVEINPLAVTPDGLVAIDSKIEIDSQSYFRNEGKIRRFADEVFQLTGTDVFAAVEDTITYVPLSGNIGLVSDGAGTGMLTVDLVTQFGGTIANFCELGGITNEEIVYKALTKAAAGEGVEKMLVVLIGGFNRMDHMAEGIVKFSKENTKKIPLYIRMCGTLEDVGRRIMQEHHISIYENLHDAVKSAVEAEMEK